MALNLPINFDALRVALIKEVQYVTGLTCIVEQPEIQNVPRPCKPYFSMHTLAPAIKSGDDDAQQNPGTSIWNHGGQRKMVVEFNCYGRTHEEAYKYMGQWQGALELETIQSDLYKAGIAVWLNGNVTDLSKLLNTGYEGRAHMSVDFGIASNLTEDQSYIETVNVSGVVTSDQGEEVDIAVSETAP